LNPPARDLFYWPVAGAVIALGIYVLFRATQLFFGGGSQDSTATVSTSVFLLAALGLASAFALASDCSDRSCGNANTAPCRKRARRRSP
jgi:hypothetical protein